MSLHSQIYRPGHISHKLKEHIAIFSTEAQAFCRAGAMYGLGYAVAEDRAFQMYYNLREMPAYYEIKDGKRRIRSFTADDAAGIQATVCGCHNLIRNTCH